MPLARPLFRPRPRATRRPTQVGFSPVTLFRPGNKGFFYDFYVAGSVFSDAARTTVATSGGPVGGVTDLSGNGNHATQATTTRRPNLTISNGRAFIQGDGIDDFLQMASLDMAGTGEATVFAAFRKLSDANAERVLEHSVGALTGSFTLQATPSAASATVGVRSGGTVQQGRGRAAAAPISTTTVGRVRISPPSISLELNGSLDPAPVTLDQGTGQYTAQPHFILSRAGTSQFFTGQLYAVGVIGRYLSNEEALQLMRWLNVRIGAY